MQPKSLVERLAKSSGGHTMLDVREAVAAGSLLTSNRLSTANKRGWLGGGASKARDLGRAEHVRSRCPSGPARGGVDLRISARPNRGGDAESFWIHEVVAARGGGAPPYRVEPAVRRTDPRGGGAPLSPRPRR